MKTLSVSTDVFAALWAQRQPGEETEDQILRRVLGCNPQRESFTGDRGGQSDGYYADQFNVHFPEGSEIYRVYKGKEYRAKATGGRWLLINDGQTYPSLHKLSYAVVQGRENAWMSWRFRKPDGSEAFIDALREGSKISRRLS